MVFLTFPWNITYTAKKILEPHLCLKSQATTHVSTANSSLSGLIGGQITHYIQLMLEIVIQSNPCGASFGLRQLPNLDKRCFLWRLADLHTAAPAAYSGCDTPAFRAGVPYCDPPSSSIPPTKNHLALSRANHRAKLLTSC